MLIFHTYFFGKKCRAPLKLTELLCLCWGSRCVKLIDWFAVRQDKMNDATGVLELTANSSADIDIESTVPLGLANCVDLSFLYDHPGSNMRRSACQLFFRHGKTSDQLTLRVESTPGCISYSSVLRFTPFDKPLSHPSMWHGYAPADIQVSSVLGLRYRNIYLFFYRCADYKAQSML